ncbi:nitroreductase [Hahella sp. CCB-MM4]|uniref:nitroreductase family protein n=1 Tax=Hahella sp. (strain CCB-MM4) TaxID=1926491 RepID=UPI000B9BAB44|nr:nitroreductase [Hahella sp. CCB-MM4]OZG73862.1 nitroreductase [Hahella sp. CCB-MM4]
MDMLSILSARYSSPLLESPAPSKQELESVYDAMMRAPDHARLRPLRLQVWQGDGLGKLGQVFVDYTLRKDSQATPEAVERARGRPLRAPMVISVIARIEEHPKVPEVEQIVSAGCSAYILLLGLDALGYGGMWRTGDIAYDPQACKDMGLADNEKLVGFVYVGTPVERQVKTVDAPAFDERVQFITE